MKRIYVIAFNTLKLLQICPLVHQAQFPGHRMASNITSFEQTNTSTKDTGLYKLDYSWGQPSKTNLIQSDPMF